MHMYTSWDGTDPSYPDKKQPPPQFRNLGQANLVQHDITL
jgi:hypothetical protein